MSTQIRDHKEFFIEKTGNAICSNEIKDFSCDQMLLGGYKYDAF